jgi:hypothetical protein
MTGFLSIELAMGVSPQRLHWDGLMGLVRWYAPIAALVLGLSGNNRARFSAPNSGPSSWVEDQARYLVSRVGLLALLLFAMIAAGYLISRSISDPSELHWHYWVVLITQGWIGLCVGSLMLVTARALETLLVSTLASYAVTSILLLSSVLKPLWTDILATDLKIALPVGTFLCLIIPDGHLWDLWTPGSDLEIGTVLKQAIGSTAAILLLMLPAGGMLWITSRVRNSYSSPSN